MSGPFLSEMWYRVAELRPQLHPHVRIFRQRFRGRAWYVLNDRSTGRVHRFTPATYALIDGMDGHQTLDALWSGLAESLGDNAPSQDEVIQLLYQLHAADVLQVGAMPDLAEAVERRRKQSRSVWIRNLANPMALRIPLWDPNRFLEQTWPLVSWLFSPLGALLWLAVVVGAGIQAARNWAPLTENLADRVLGLENLLLLWLSYPIIKICHELGHAYAVKRGGGEVHEMGVMFLVFAPVPYVDASASAAFRGKWQRIGVSAAGIVVEVFIASLAMFVWLAAEPGVVRAMAFNVMLIGGVSTVLFNANPLLRFDGYFMLSDFLEIPNLAQRSNKYLAYLAKRYAFGRSQAESPGHTPGETLWLTLFAPVSWVYRLFIMVAIALFIASEYFFIGVILAIWSLITMLVWPMAKGLFFVLGNAELDRHRKRALIATFGGVAAIVLLAGIVPAPHWTNAEGVIWVPQNAEVRAGTSGFVTRVLAQPGRGVAEGEALLELADPDLSTEIQARQARVQQLEIQLSMEMFDDRLKAELTRQNLESELAALARYEHRHDDLVALAGRSGSWVVPNAGDLPGKFFQQGVLIGYVMSGNLRSVRVVVPQADADLVRGRTSKI
jgi:putative peptide zinc metalloprotease protein